MPMTITWLAEYFGTKKKCIPRGENHYKSGHVLKCRHYRGELTGEVKASMKSRIYTVSVSADSVSPSVSPYARKSLYFNKDSLIVCRFQRRVALSHHVWLLKTNPMRNRQCPNAPMWCVTCVI